MKNCNGRVSASLEDYLEAIYFVGQKNDTVRITDIAIELGISKSSVNRAINTLKSQNLVLHEHYGALQLTEQGYKIAENVAKRHNILKRFLIEILKVDEKRAEEEACLIEHSLSMDTILRISKLLND